MKFKEKAVDLTTTNMIVMLLFLIKDHICY